jgi:hypothetical protein
MPSISTKTFLKAVEDGLLPKIVVVRGPQTVAAPINLSKDSKELISGGGEPDLGNSIVPKYSKVESAVQNTESAADTISSLAFKAYLAQLAATKAIPAIAAAAGKNVPAIVPRLAGGLATTGKVLGVASEVPTILWGADAIRSAADPALVEKTKEATSDQIEEAIQTGNYRGPLTNVVGSAIQRPTSTLSALSSNIQDAALDKLAAEEDLKVRRFALKQAQRQALLARGDVPEVKMGSTKAQDTSAANKFFGRIAPAEYAKNSK